MIFDNTLGFFFLSYEVSFSLISTLTKVQVLIHLYQKKTFKHVITLFILPMVCDNVPKAKKKDVENTIKLYLFNRLLKPILVRNVYESIHNGTEALMFPQRHHFAGIVDDFWGSVQHSLPDSAQVTQVEDVVELGGGGQHLDLDPLPHLPRGRHKGVNQFTDFLREFPPLLEQMVILFIVDFRVRFGILLQSTLITKISNTF